MLLLHVAKKMDWEKSLNEGKYGQFSLNKDGFIHCSVVEHLVEVANNNLKQVEEPLVVLCIDTDRLDAKIKWEKRGNKGISFPHVYGLINTESVIEVVPFNKNNQGNFYFPEELNKYIKREKSCGAIVFHTFAEGKKVLLIKNINGQYWSFPKGHVENNETEIETAIREVKEETNLDIDVDTNFREVVQYSPLREIIKDVIYFAAYSKSTNVHIQEEELADARWYGLNEALKVVTHDNDRKILKKAVDYALK